MGFQLAACDMLILDANDTATEPREYCGPNAFFESPGACSKVWRRALTSFTARRHMIEQNSKPHVG